MIVTTGFILDVDEHIKKGHPTVMVEWPRWLLGSCEWLIVVVLFLLDE